MRIRWQVAVVAGVGALLSTGALLYAFNPQPDPPGHYYGLMTVQRGQHMSLHVSNTKMAVDAFRPANSNCVARLQLVDACGQVLAESSGRLVPRESLSLNFTVPPDEGLPPDPDHPPDTDHPPCAVMANPPDDSLPGGADPPDDGIAPDSGKLRLRAQIVFTGPAGHCVSSLEVGDPFVGDPTGLRTGGSGFIHPGSIVGFNPQPDPPGAPTKTPR